MPHYRNINVDNEDYKYVIGRWNIIIRDTQNKKYEFEIQDCGFSEWDVEDGNARITPSIIKKVIERKILLKGDDNDKLSLVGS
jgi:hypothetical protein